jgi:hypothetical protein
LPVAIFSWFASSFLLDGCFPGALRLCLQQGVTNTCELTFIAKEGEDGRSQQYQLPQDKLRSPPMIKHRHRRQRADEKETDLANTEQDMTQYNTVTELDLRLQTPSIPIGCLHYRKAKHRDGKVAGRTHHDLSGGQLLVIRKRVPEKHLGSYNLRDYRAPKQRFACGAVHYRTFEQLRTVEPRDRKLKASDNALIDRLQLATRPIPFSGKLSSRVKRSLAWKCAACG